MMAHLRLYLLVLLGLASLPLPAQPVMFDEPLSPRIANYQMDIRLDTAEKTITGTSLVSFRNPSTDTIPDLQFHLYLNAFKHTGSTFLAETRGNVFGKQLGPEVPENEWGGVWVHAMTLPDGRSLKDSMRYLRPEGASPLDQTVLQVMLPEPILPGATQQVQLAFTIKLPRIMIRSGYSLDHYYLAVQWFPKLGVYEPEGLRQRAKGGWNCHPYHSGAEYYADFGVYDVAIRVPENLVVGASGVNWKQEPQSDGTITHHYRVEDVIDFAWTASPRFVEVKDHWKDVSIRLLMQPEHLHQQDRYLKAIKLAFDFFDTHIGPYPYPTLTIVDPPMHGFRSGAMEYPTLITATTLGYLGRGLRLTEALTVHEFCHQYFMQMVASNEMEEPWLDEGLTSYFEERIMDAAYGPQSADIDVWGFQAGDHENSRFRYTGMANPHLGPTLELPWKLPPGVAHTLNYSKASTALHTLEGVLGQEVLDRVFRTYFERWKFRHPSSQDFFDVLKEVAEAELGDALRLDIPRFFEQVFQETGTCDYALAGIARREAVPLLGIDLPQGVSQVEEAFTEVTVDRLGEVVVPQELLVLTEAGDSLWFRWDGVPRRKAFRIPAAHAVVAASLDPHTRIHLDLNYLNNSLSLKPDARPAGKYTAMLLFWLEQLWWLLGALV